jgi:hypothetical protein
MFAGSTFAKVMAFLVLGFVGAVVGGTLGALYLPAGWDLLGLIAGIVLGFAVGGLLGLALIPLGIGLAVGYAAYLLALDFAFGQTVAIVVGVAFFVVGLALSGKILKVVTAIAGGLLLFHVLTYSGLGLTLSTLIAAALALIGLWVQFVSGRRVTQPTTAQVGGRPSDHS